MCGFCGIAHAGTQPVDRLLLTAMNQRLAHRGPDGDGFFLRGHIGLGHRRLSIIDVEGGDQPIYNEDGSIVVVFNGEIYNYRELRKELLAENHVLKTQSDTEVLVHLYEEHGLDFVSHLRGMFAFALYDMKRDRLILVRDRFGIKPLYFHEAGGRLLFASEIKPLITAGYTVEVNRRGIDLYTRTRFAHGDETLFKGVHRLAEGTMLIWERGQSQLKRYYDTPYIDGRDKGGDIEERFEAALAESIDFHLVSDVPVGAYLSGGVDSTIIVQSMIGRADLPVSTYCVDFEGATSEANIAEQTAKSLGCSHHSVFCGVEELLQLPQVIEALEEPVGDPVVVAQYFLSRMARDTGIKVVMTGDGADEILGGYPFIATTASAMGAKRILQSPINSIFSAVAERLPLSIVRYLSNISLDLAEEARARLVRVLRDMPRMSEQDIFDLLLSLFRSDELAAIYSSAFRQEMEAELIESLAGIPNGISLKDRALSLSYRKWLPANINMKTDKLSMAHSIETRVPFLDHPLVEFLSQVPAQWKFSGRRNKILLRDLAKKWSVPNHIWAGKKMPFHLPMETYIKDPRVQNMIEENLSPSRLLRRNIYNVDYVGDLKNRALKGDYHETKKLMAIVIMELWFRRFVDSEALMA